MVQPETPDNPDPSRVLPRNVRVAGWASLLNDTASEMVYPLLPHFLLNFLHGNRLHLGLIEGVADTVAGFVKLWSGGYSDRAGRRKGLIVAGYSVPALLRPLTGLIAAPWQLFSIRVADRIGKGIRSAPRDALIADSTDPAMRGRAFGFHRGMDNLGAAIGPLLAAGFLWCWPEGMRTLFLLAILPGLLVVLLVVLGLREKPVSSSPRPRFRLSLQPFDRNFRFYLLTLVIFTLGNSSDVFLLVRAGELGIAPVVLPLLWCTCNIAKSASNLLFGPAVDRFGPRQTLLLGWLGFAGIYLAFGLAANAWQIWAVFVVYGIVGGLIEPAERALVAQLVESDRKGLAYGWYNFSVGLATLPASLLCGALYQYSGPLAAFFCGAGLALTAAALLLGVVVKPRAAG